MNGNWNFDPNMQVKLTSNAPVTTRPIDERRGMTEAEKLAADVRSILDSQNQYGPNKR